jgi:cysteinyl-tRNA synthetase
LFKKEKLKITDEVQDLAKKRFEAKKNKNYELADKLREEILVL